MEHQLRTITGFVLCFLLALMSLALLVTAPVSAEEPSLAAANTSGAITGTETTPPNLQVTKVLVANQAANLTSATNTYTIDFAPKSINGDTNVTPPALPSVSIVLSKVGYSSNGTVYYMNSAPVLPDGFSNSCEATGAGYYYYTVTEQDGSTGDAVTYSKAEYTLILLVANRSSGSGVYIAGAMVQQDKDNNGTSIADTPKVDLTMGSGIASQYNQFLFVNQFSPSSSLTIKELTKGAYANMNKSFTLTIGLTARPVYKDVRTYKADLMKDGQVIKNYSFSSGVVSDANGNYIAPVTQAIPFTSGETLVFKDLPIGTSYTVSEQHVNMYTTSGELVYGGTSANLTAASGNNAFEISSATTKNMNIVMSRENTATVINTFNVSSPTGFIINNLPYVILAAAGIGILVYLSVKKRRHA